MATKLPRITGHVQPKTKAQLSEISRTTGRPIGQILDVAIENLSVDRKDWVAQQAGYQTMLAVALLMALARKQLGNDQFAQVRDLAAQAALRVFGPLGERPFDIPVGFQWMRDWRPYSWPSSPMTIGKRVRHWRGLERGALVVSNGGLRHRPVLS